jgi:hypothetical protein
MTYYLRKQPVEARAIPEPPHVRSVRVRGGQQMATGNLGEITERRTPSMGWEAVAISVSGAPALRSWGAYGS